MRGATTAQYRNCTTRLYFNPHSPCGERLYHVSFIHYFLGFQSTLPMRGATTRCKRCTTNILHFNPHSPCGERPRLLVLKYADLLISIHTPHAGSDLSDTVTSSSGTEFQSTLPMRGATHPRSQTIPIPLDFNPHSPCGERRRFNSVHMRSKLISIHTPHAGSDLS